MEYAIFFRLKFTYRGKQTCAGNEERNINFCDVESAARSAQPLDTPGRRSYGRSNAPNTLPGHSGTYIKYFLNSFLVGTSFVPASAIERHSLGHSRSSEHTFLL